MDEYDKYQCNICNYLYDLECGEPEAGEEALLVTSFKHYSLLPTIIPPLFFIFFHP